MNVSNRDVLIDYILGRLSQTDAEALEKQARDDAELTQTLDALRRELSDVASFSNLRGFPRVLNRRLHDSSASTFRPVGSEIKNDVPSRDAKATPENKSDAHDSFPVKAAERTSNEESVPTSDGKAESDSWNSLFSDAFASFAKENAEAREKAVAFARTRAAKRAEIKPVAVVPAPNTPLRPVEPINSDAGDSRDQANEAPNAFNKKTNGALSLYDVEVRTSSQPTRRRKRFEFVPKRAQAPTSADASGFVFKRAVPFSYDEQNGKRRRFGRKLEASAPVLGERVVPTRASLDFVDSIPDFSSSLTIRVRVLRSKLAFSAPCSLVDDSPLFSLSCRRGSNEFFTRATVAASVERTETLFDVSPDGGRGAFALRRGTIDSDLSDVEILVPPVATTFWTFDVGDASDAWLVASTPYAPSSSELELRRRVERVLAEKASRQEIEQAAEFVLPEIKEESAVVPLPETELTEESFVVEETAFDSGTAPTPEVDESSVTEFSEESSVVEETASELGTTATSAIKETESAEESSVVEESAFEPATTATSAIEETPVAESTEESTSETSKARAKLAFPVATFDVRPTEPTTSEYVAPELSAPKSKLEQEPETAPEAPLEELEETPLQGAVVVPQKADSYYASDDVSLEDAEEFGPTLSAEDRRLAELLGHTPTPLELDEFYWEDWDEASRPKKKASESNAAFQLLGGVFYVVTAPVVFVGHATLGFVDLFMPRRSEEKALDDLKRGSRRRRRKRDAFLDVAVPGVAGVLIAVFLVFPFLLRSVDYAAHSIVGDVFRRVTGKVAVPDVLDEKLGAQMSAKIIETQLEAQDAQNAEDAALENRDDADELSFPDE